MLIDGIGAASKLWLSKTETPDFLGALSRDIGAESGQSNALALIIRSPQSVARLDVNSVRLKLPVLNTRFSIT